jgi:HSP20 family protein
MDISETEHEIVVRALLPGMGKEDVKISLHQNVLSISGERKAAEVPEGGRVLRSERSSGHFQRTLRLNKPVEVDQIHAGLQDGVLTLTLPLREEAKPKQIEVAVN